MNVLETIKKKLIQLFKIQPAQNYSVYVQERFTLENDILKNRLIYRGDISELMQFFSQIENTGHSFWGDVNYKARKIHLPYVASVVDLYSNMVTSDLNSITINDDKTNELFDEIAEDNKLKKLIEKATKEALITGDSVFKITYDTAISNFPIVEVVSGEYIDYEYNRGRLEKVIFYSDLKENKKNYRLAEIYEYGAINYELFDEYGNRLSLDTLEQTENLQSITFDKSLLLAIPVKFFDNPKFANRGKALFDSKTDIVDALDEIASDWLDGVRKGRVKVYIPESCLPRDPETGNLVTAGMDFQDNYVKVAGSMEEGKDVIQTIQPTIEYSAYTNSFTSYLEMLLQGIISPSTLGIDISAQSTAESQREKEKVTLFIRQKITSELTETLKQLVNTLLNTYNIAHSKKLQSYEVNVSFGEYASTDFASVVETVSKAKMSGIMSIEQCVNELYGDTLTDEEKQQEIERIKAEQGYEEIDLSLVGDSEEEVEEDNMSVTNKFPTVNIDGEKIKELAEQLGRKELKDIYNKLP